MTDHPGYGYSPPGQPGYVPGTGYVPSAPPRKKRRIFLWVFLAIQALFVIWLITGIVSSAHGIPAYCHQGNNSQYIGVKGCTEASQTGAAIGVALVIVLWMVVDVILGVSYGVYRLATRNR